MNKRQRKKKNMSCYPWTRTRDGRKILFIGKTITKFGKHSLIAISFPILAVIEEENGVLTFTYTSKGRYFDNEHEHYLDLMGK